MEHLSDHEDPPAQKDGPSAAADRASVPDVWRRPGAVLCLGGRGSLDDAVAGALAQLLGRRGFGTAVASHDMLGKARIGDLPIDDARLVVLSCLDGSSAAYLRFALRRLSRHRPDVPLLVGAWWRRAEDAQAAVEDGGVAAEADRDALGNRDAVPGLAEAVIHALRLASPDGTGEAPARRPAHDHAVARP